MARSPKSLAYMKAVRSRGKRYGYFDTGQKDARGNRIYAPLGRMDAPEFGAKYAAALGHRMRRATIVSVFTTASLLDLYQKGEHYRSRSDATRKVYDLYMTEFVRNLPTAPAGEVERRDVMLIIDAMADRPAAANLMLASIRALYTWGRKRGHVENDPCRDIDQLDIGEHQPWPETLLTDALAAEDARIRLAVHLLYYTAQRIGDVCAMRWRDVGPGGISITQKKTGKQLLIPIHGDLRALLDATPRRGMTILAYDNGRPITQDRIRFWLRDWLSDRTTERFVPHGLRKNAVNALLECGCSVAETSAISGQSLRIVEHYAKGRDQRKLASAAILKWERKA